MPVIGTIFESRPLMISRTPPWAKANKAVVIKKVPYTAWSPSPGQAAQRIRMMDAGPAAAAATTMYRGASRVHAMNAHVSSAISGPTGLGMPPGTRARRRAYNSRARLEQIAGRGRGIGVMPAAPPGFPPPPPGYEKRGYY